MQRFWLILSLSVVWVVMLLAMTVPALAYVTTDANGNQCEVEDGMPDGASSEDDGVPDGLPVCP
jgi:hypothetical protein